MGLEILFWVWVLTWMTKTAATDVIYSLKGQAPPRHRERLARAERGESMPRRYGLDGWFADLKDDALRAHTEKRRSASEAKGRPLDDLAESVREPRPAPAGETERVRQANLDPCGLDGCPGWIVDRRAWPDGRVHQWKGDRQCTVCGWLSDHVEVGTQAPAATEPEPATSDLKLATVTTLFPNAKEIDMSNIEATGLPTAIAFAEAAARSHTSYTAAGVETYVGALERMEMGPEYINSAREAMEASSVASAKWTAHAEKLKDQNAGREFYQSNPDAAGKQALINE